MSDRGKSFDAEAKHLQQVNKALSRMIAWLTTAVAVSGLEDVASVVKPHVVSETASWRLSDKPSATHLLPTVRGRGANIDFWRLPEQSETGEDESVASTYQQLPLFK